MLFHERGKSFVAGKDLASVAVRLLGGLNGIGLAATTDWMDGREDSLDGFDVDRTGKCMDCMD
jgi:hypothetical protein